MPPPRTPFPLALLLLIVEFVAETSATSPRIAVPTPPAASPFEVDPALAATVEPTTTTFPKEPIPPIAALEVVVAVLPVTDEFDTVTALLAKRPPTARPPPLGG